MHAARTIRLIMELRGAGITDNAVLSAIERVPREIFVPMQFADQAYENLALPIAHGQTISQPLIIAQMISALQLHKKSIVLEIGTGSGYQTAILCQLCRRVYSLDIHKDFTREAEKRITKLGYNNASFLTADGSKGWQQGAPYDGIIIAAATPLVPPLLLKQLTNSGTLILPLGKASEVQHLTKINKNNATVETSSFGTARFVPLLQECMS